MGQSISDIVTAVDNNLFVDSSIKNGSFVRDDKGSLFRKVGGFAINFRLLHDDKMWAIRCWHIPIKESQDHYKKVCSFLEDANLPYLLPTKYIEKGIIHLDGSVAPITQMQWVDGVTIKEYIVTYKNDKERLYQLADNFLNLCKSMHLNHIAHGDLQHGNILIDKKASVFLIDYDSFYAPNMGDKKRDEITGLKDYQHPARTKNKFANDKLDYFSELIIFLSIVAIAENPKLADIYKIATAEHLLFTSADFSDVRNSNIYKDVANLGDEFVQLLGILEEYLSENNILNLCPIESYLNSTRFNAPLASYIELAKARDEEAWTTAVKSNTLEAFERYLANFPKGRHRIAASNRRKKILEEQEQEREDELWLEATSRNSIVFYAKYLRESVLKTHVTEANVAIYTLQKQQAQDEEEKLWAKAVNSDTIASYQSYLSTSTLKKYSKQASEAIDKLNKQKQIETEENLWQYAVGRNTLEEYQKYLKYSHLKTYATEAESRIRAIDEANWALACKTSTIDAYNAYLKTFPKGLHVADAKRKIENIVSKKEIKKFCLKTLIIVFILGILYFVVLNIGISNSINYINNTFRDIITTSKQATSSHKHVVTPPKPVKPVAKTSKSTSTNSNVGNNKKKEDTASLSNYEKDMIDMLEAMEGAKEIGFKIDPKMMKKAEGILPKLINSPKYDQYKQRLNKLQ